MSATDPSTQILSDSVAAVTDMRWFVESAKQYVLQGLALDDMCDLNADVAFSLQRNQVIQDLPKSFLDLFCEGKGFLVTVIFPN